MSAECSCSSVVQRVWFGLGTYLIGGTTPVFEFYLPVILLSTLAIKTVTDIPIWGRGPSKAWLSQSFRSKRAKLNQEKMPRGSGKYENWRRGPCTSVHEPAKLQVHPKVSMQNTPKEAKILRAKDVSKPLCRSYSNPECYVWGGNPKELSNGLEKWPNIATTAYTEVSQNL